ncbi:hypothetical protein GT043_00685, partial [Streptomyces sp. SID2131]|nr:hypothetical protein [Streptomyces sp. SID2131]
YAAAADVLAARRERLLDEVRRDMADFALLVDAWGSLARASEGHPPSPADEDRSPSAARETPPPSPKGTA